MKSISGLALDLGQWDVKPTEKVSISAFQLHVST